MPTIFPHTCTIIHSTEEKGERLGSEWRHEVSATDVACFVQPTNADEDVRNAQTGMKVTHKVYFATKPSLSTAKNFVYWVDAAGEGHVLEHRGNRDGTAGLGVAYRFDAEELTAWPNNLPVG